MGLKPMEVASASRCRLAPCLLSKRVRAENRKFSYSVGGSQTLHQDSSYGNVLKNKVGRLCSQPQPFTASVRRALRRPSSYIRAQLCAFSESRASP